MTSDDIKQAWDSQMSEMRMTIDVPGLDAETRRFQQHFAAILFWRDAREIGTSLVLIVVWLVMGGTMNLPWAWYLEIPALLWIAAFMSFDRRRSSQHQPAADAPLRERLQGNLASVEHQIWLLRSVRWWYLLPLGAPMLAFFAQVSWRASLAAWDPSAKFPLLGAIAGGVAGFSVMAAFVGAVFYFVDWLNQYAVRTDLQPRAEQLRGQVRSLDEETADGGPGTPE
jgi:hypothetical protein